MIDQELSLSGYDKIKAAARERDCDIDDLLALHRTNDPFFAGSPAQVKRAEWFARLWSDRAFANGTHLRRIHYQLVTGAESVRMVDDKPYENTLECWKYLGDSSKYARHLEMVAPDA